MTETQEQVSKWQLKEEAQDTKNNVINPKKNNFFILVFYIKLIVQMYIKYCLYAKDNM